jgi:hypothetical protein
MPTSRIEERTATAAAFRALGKLLSQLVYFLRLTFHEERFGRREREQFAKVRAAK